MAKVRSNGKQMSLNIVSQTLAFVINLAIGFFLTPYLIRTVGRTAYGFVGLANNFVSYAQILVTALNSMAGRFIAIKYYKNDYKDVKKYYTSVLFANIFMTMVLSIPATILILFIDKIVDTGTVNIPDIQVLWMFIFLTLFIQIIGSIFNNAAYVKNRLDIVSARNIEANLIRVALLVGLYALLPSKVWYIGIGSCASSLFNVFRNYNISRKLMPFVRINRKFFDFGKIREIVSSGVWNSINSLSNVLSDGLDLLITNLLVSGDAMGVVSIAKTIPTYINSMFAVVGNTFAPQLTKSFAEENYNSMKKQMNFAIKLMGVFLSIPIAIFFAFGKSFYKLWVPSQDYNLLWILSIITVFSYTISLSFYPLNNIFTSVNKVRQSSIVAIVFSCLSVGTVFITLNIVESETVKMVAIICVSAIYMCLRSVFYIAPFGAKYIGLNKFTFFGPLFKNIISVAVVCAVSFAFSFIFIASSWIKLIIACILVAAFALAINFFLILNREERKRVLSMIKHKLHKA